MLELKNISFYADTDNGKKEILKNISLTIDDRFVAITGQRWRQIYSCQGHRRYYSAHERADPS